MGDIESSWMPPASFSRAIKRLAPSGWMRAAR